MWAMRRIFALWNMHRSGPTRKDETSRLISSTNEIGKAADVEGRIMLVHAIQIHCISQYTYSA